CFTVRFLIEYAMQHHELEKPKEHQTLIVIDEAAILFPKKDYDKREFQLWMTFFRLHRQLGYDVILITQNHKDVNGDVLGLVEYNFKHRLLTSFGLKGWLLVAIFRKKFISVKYWYVIDEKCDSYMFNIRKRITRLYDTFGMAKRLHEDVMKMIENLELENAESVPKFDVKSLNERVKKNEK
ncbi:MAG: zonular occludens toxin domain-containing protein, partial [Ruminiclostridium sp.]|nr:zonular occludens toxin domain-containing protein [Ruminiclostridium sp.]